MKILLAKCHKNTIFSRVEPIVTEPLELEYLASIFDDMELIYKIYDSLIENNSFKEVVQKYKPDVLILSGYITAVNRIIEWSKYVKSININTKVVVGGVHAEINYRDFFVDTIDIIVHSDGINTLKKIADINFNTEDIVGVKGIAFQLDGKWKVNDRVKTCLENMPLPNRSYFNKNRSRTKYLHYSPVAIIKTSLSCPHSCNFCYCRLLNMGEYSVRSIKSIIEEIKKIKSKYIWIVDDTFLIDRNRVLKFIDEIKTNNINKKFIAYSRVDFIANNEDVISKLGEIGFIELIVGMEAIEDKQLNSFNKNASALQNIKTVKVLNNYQIRLTALFIVGIDFTLKDFKNMRQWIRKVGLKSYTASIFTPMKGTEIYREYEDRIVDKDHCKNDFLHLTLKPVHMNKVLFYFQFYLIYIEQFFKSKYIRSYILKNLRNFITTGGRNG